MEAAVAGGVTSLACPPDTDPPLDEPGLVEMLKHRARSLNQAHVYPIGALTVGLAGRDADRDGRARRGRLRRLLAGRRAAGRHAGAAARDAVRGDLRLPRLAARRRTRTSARGGVAHDGEVATRLGLAGDSGGGRNHRARDDPRAGARNRRARPPVPAVDAPRASRWCAPRSGRACPSPATSPSITCTCATSTSAGSTRNAASMPPLRSTRDRDALRAGARRRHDRPRLLRPHAGRRRRQAGAVRRGGARRHRAGTAAAADAQMGGRGPGRAARRARAHHGAAGGGARHATPGTSASARRRHLHLRPGRCTGGSSRAALQSQGKNTPFLGPRSAGQGALHAGRRAGRPRS